jgi:hypothetical protein
VVAATADVAVVDRERLVYNNQSGRWFSTSSGSKPCEEAPPRSGARGVHRGGKFMRDGYCPRQLTRIGPPLPALTEKAVNARSLSATDPIAFRHSSRWDQSLQQELKSHCGHWPLGRRSGRRSEKRAPRSDAPLNAPRAPALGSPGLMTRLPVSLGPAPLTSSLQPRRELLRSIAAAAFGELLTEILAALYLAPVP